MVIKSTNKVAGVSSTGGARKVSEVKKWPTISMLIPCYNEEKMVQSCILSCLKQSHQADQIIFVDDCSKDRTPELLAEFGDQITVIRTPKNTGNKSSAQEYGLQFVTGDILITTDADTVLDYTFIEEIIKPFHEENVAAVGGYVVSMKYNWITRCRAFDYSIGQNIHKLAQSYINFVFVIPGAAGAFRTDVFRKYLAFDHDTITEDLDFTFKIHKTGMKVRYNRNALVYTQDPSNISSYINQMRRWFGGGWQNLMKHIDIVGRPAQALELSLMYIEGLVFSGLLLILPLINLRLTLILLVPYFIVTFLFSIYASVREKRADLMLAPVPYLFLMYINAFIFWEGFIKEVILGKRNLTWLQPERVSIKSAK